MWYHFNHHKELERKVEKLRHMKLEVMKPKIKIKSELPARDKLLPAKVSYVYYIKIGRGGLKERGSLITFPE